MALRFAHWDDLPLDRAPLKEVVCQVRFQPILAITETQPTAYQERLRKHFPKFEVRRALHFEEVQSSGIVAGLGPNEYALSSSDGAWHSTIGLNFIALTTQAYTNWNDFKKRIGTIYTAFRASYDDVVIGRIGLRFINELRYDNTAAKTEAELVGIVNNDLSRLIINDAWTKAQKANVLLTLDNDREYLTIRAGYETKDQPRIVLDFDYYTESPPSASLTQPRLVKLLDHFHSCIYDAFRWTIKEDQVARFGPRKANRSRSK